MNLRLLTFCLFSVAYAGCVAGTTSERIAGHYDMVQGGFNESLTVDLNADGSYVLDHELFACVIGPNGEMPITYSREQGRWRRSGNQILLEPSERTPGFPDASVFAPALARKLVMESPSKLANADFPKSFVLEKSNQPHHAASTL